MIWAGFLSGFGFVLTTMAIRGDLGFGSQVGFDIMALAPAVLAGGVGAFIGWVKVRRMKAGSPPWTIEEYRGLSVDLWIMVPFALVSSGLIGFAAMLAGASFWGLAFFSFVVIWFTGYGYRAYLISRERSRSHAPRPASEDARGQPGTSPSSD